MPFHIRGFFILFTLVIIGFLVWGYFVPDVLWVFIILGPLFALSIYDSIQSKHTILRNFPLIGHFRYIFEGIRPEINQYFIESDVEGRPFNRIRRAIVYQRAKGVLDKEPFGTKLDYDSPGYDWLLHSSLPEPIIEEDLRVTIGNDQCSQPYDSSIFNTSALSFGSLSDRAVLAMNGGAKIGHFAQNTGEGGISDYHLYYGGDLIWQIGTGYFGCRNNEGEFDKDGFRKNAQRPEVKMIEIKLSQGAKPGQGGILPAKKNNEEIARAREIEPFCDVISPSYHTAFSTPKGLLEFVQDLRECCHGKPVGFKLCIGHENEFLGICKAIIETGIKPDFITIDGAEGGTGAAPVEFSNSVGMPLIEGLTFAYNALYGFGLKKDISLVASGKAVTGFDIVRLMALGADVINSGRAMMMAIGCIQALRCHNNSCPTGVTTHDPQLKRGLVVEDKKHRLANYHKNTIKSVRELLSSAGIRNPESLDRTFIERRIGPKSVMRLDELFPYIPENSLLKPPYPEDLHNDMMQSSAENFHQKSEAVYKE